MNLIEMRNHFRKAMGDKLSGLRRTDEPEEVDFSQFYFSAGRCSDALSQVEKADMLRAAADKISRGRFLRMDILKVETIEGESK